MNMNSITVFLEADPAFQKREIPHAKPRKLTEISDYSRIEMCKESARDVGHYHEEYRMQGEEVKQFYAGLVMLRSRCIDGDDERFTFVPGSTAKVYLIHDQYQALEEILTELPNAMERHGDGYRAHGHEHTAQFPRSYAARKCNSTTTWIGRGSTSYDRLLDICDGMLVDLESLLLEAEALLSLLCETVPNFEVLWLECLNALSVLCSTPETGTHSQSSLLRAWIKCPQHWTPFLWSGKPLRYDEWPLYSFTRESHTAATVDNHLAPCLKRTMHLLSLRFASSLFSEDGRQLHSYLRGRVSAVHQDRTNMVPTRKELPMIIGGKEIKAQHDSGAERGNFIDCDLASKLNLRLRNEKGDCKRFSMGNGKVVKALGRVKAVCAFAKEVQTKMKCWFYVFDGLASPLIMGSQFLEKTKTLSDHVHRLEDCIPNPGISPMVNLIGSTQHAKRRFTAHIDHRLTLINADTGSDLDLMSSTYARAHGYRLDRRRRCRKRVRFADNTIAETIGQVQATLTLEDGSMYPRMFDVLPNLTSEVLLGQFTLEEISAFRFHRSSFVDVFAGERHLELSVLGYLGKVNEFLASKLRRVHRRRILRRNQAKLLQYHFKRLGFATNSRISIACETTGRRSDGSSTGPRLGSREAPPPE